MRASKLALLVLLSVSSSASAATFADISFDAACKQSAAEKKVVVIDFFTTWCVPCKVMDQKTWPDPAVTKLFDSEAVSLRVDAEKQVDLAKRYRLDAYPTILILNPDGTEIDRLVGFREPKQLVADFTAARRGQDSIARARAAVAASPRNPSARSQLADDLAQRQHYAEALKEYLWCFDEGGKAYPSYDGVRLSFLLTEIRSLGRAYPEATAALEARRTEREARVMADSADDLSIRELSSLNRSLGKADQNLALLDRLPENAKARPILIKHSRSQLIETKRYEDVLAGTDVLGDMDSFARRLKKSLDDSSVADRAEAESMTRRVIVAIGAEYYEALAGVRRDADARALADKILAVDNTPAAIKTLNDRARRAGNTDLVLPGPAAP